MSKKNKQRLVGIERFLDRIFENPGFSEKGLYQMNPEVLSELMKEIANLILTLYPQERAVLRALYNLQNSGPGLSAQEALNLLRKEFAQLQIRNESQLWQIEKTAIDRIQHRARRHRLADIKILLNVG